MALSQTSSDTLIPPFGYTPADNTALSDRFAHTISNVLGILTFIAALAFIYYIMLATINLTISGGDEEKAKKAQQMLLHAIIGMAITAAAYPLVYLLGNLLGVPFDSPAELIGQLF